MKETVTLPAGRVARLHRPPSDLQVQVVEGLQQLGHRCRWEGRDWLHEEIHFLGLDQLDYAGPLCEVWVEFSNPYTLDGAKLYVDCPHPYRGRVRTLYLSAFEFITTTAREARA